MRLDEFDAFRSEILQLCASLGKKYTDALGQAYWRALKDISLDELQAHVERLLLSATSETKFPRPAQLRSSPAVGGHGPSLADDPKLKETMEHNRKTWEEFHASDPELCAIELGIARAGRLLVAEREGSTFYAEALKEDRVFRDERRALMDKRREKKAA